MGSVSPRTVPLVGKLKSLREEISPEASIDLHTDEAYKITAQRWSDYHGPKPGAVVNVASEQDVEQTVSWAVSNNVKFLAQSGGHGWTTSFSIGKEDIVINLRLLNSVSFNKENTTFTVGGGTLVHELVAEAAKNKVNVTTGTCNAIGVVGSYVGGGLGRFQGLHGLGVDNMISARLVTSAGKTISVSKTENSDLWWGLRGAGHGFGIISSLTVQAHPWINDGMYWTNLAVFTPDKIEDLAEAVNNLDWDQGMCVHWMFMPIPPTFEPAVALIIWYPGDEDPARKAFSSVFSLGPVMEQAAMTPYTGINVMGDPFCAKGGQKGTYAAALPSKLSGPTLSKIWGLYVAFVKDHKDAALSAVMFECYSTKKVLEIATEETAYAFRHLPHHGVILPAYTDPATADAAKMFGSTCRQLLRDASGLESTCYVNFANGDEKEEEMYGRNVERLRSLKDTWDPRRAFSQFNSIY